MPTPFPALRRDRHDLVEVAELGRRRELRHLLVLAGAVDLVHHGDLRARARAGPVRSYTNASPRPTPRRRVDHVQDHVDALDRVADHVVQSRAERRPRLVEPGRVGEDDLRVVGREHGVQRRDGSSAACPRRSPPSCPTSAFTSVDLPTFGRPDHGDDPAGDASPRAIEVVRTEGVGQQVPETPPCADAARSLRDDRRVRRRRTPTAPGGSRRTAASASSASVATATARILSLPDATIDATALRSAQTESG